MADQFKYGEQVSRAKMMGLLDSIRDQGSDVLDALGRAVDDTLAGLNRKLQAMNGRVQRANRSRVPTTPVRFLVSDFLDIDQGSTTATIRADVQSSHLRERSIPVTAVVQRITFLPTVGSVEQLDKAGTQFRVHTDDAGGQIPTGIFDIQLTESDRLTFLVFDIVPMPSQPAIKVEVSSDSIAYTTAQDVALDADRVTAWLKPQEVRYIRLTLVPSHPDELSGSSFSFGVLNLTGSGTDYQLQSELVTRPITFAPQSKRLRFVADTVPGVSYFLALGAEAAYTEIHPGDAILLPGSGSQAPTSVGFVGVPWSDPLNTGSTVASTPLITGAYVRPTTPNGFVYQVTVAGTTGSAEPAWPVVAGNTISSGGVTFTTIVDGILNHTLATNAYLRTISIIGDDDGKPVTAAIGLSYQDPHIAKLTRRYIAISGTQLRYVSNDESLDTGRTFTLSYDTGPAQLEVRFKVRLTSSDRSITPVFTGASLQEV